MGRPNLRVPVVSFLSLVFVLGCSGATEQTLVGQFFNASRLRDNTSLDNIATVIFDPGTQGTVTSFSIQSVGPEQRNPLPLKSLAKLQDDAKAEDAAFSSRKDDYQTANLDAIQRVLRAERDHVKVAPKDAEVQAAWTKLREESARVSTKASEARRRLRSETQLVDLSINGGGRTAIDVTKYDGEMVGKDVTVSAPVRLPSGQTATKTLVLTMQRAILKGDKEITGRWIITALKDTASAPALKTS
ncbi:MAG TPA: hypothetical protein VH583_22100 [Vicinamibacterales bacterium]|jgi:hypothetical protein